MCHILENGTFWIAFTAVIALASLFTTIHLVSKQLKFNKRDLQIRMQLQLDEQFNSIRIIKARKKIAESLLKKDSHSKEIIMEFFESMGLLLRKKYLDDEMIWATFSFYIIHWWEASKKIIERKQKNDLTLYTDFKILVERMYEIEKIEQKAKQMKDIIPTEDEITIFLSEEKELLTW